MTIAQQHIDHLGTMKDSVEDVLREILVEHKGEIIDIIRFKQLAKGLNSYGKPLQWAYGSGYYAKATQGYAKKQGISVPKTKGAPYNFQWTGDTFDGMGFKLTTKSYEIFTIGGKQRMLERLYGEIFELTEEHNNYINKKILEPNLAKWVEENWWKIL